MTDETFSPTIRNSILINSKCAIITASYRFYIFKRLAVLIKQNSLWKPMCLLISYANLTICIETPNIQRIFRGQGCSVAKTRWTTDNLGLFPITFIWKLDRLWSSYFSVSTQTKLAEFSLTPTIHFTLISYSERVICTSFNWLNKFSMEWFDIAWNRCDLDRLW